MSQDIISSFQRYEVKYFLTPRQREHLLPELEEHFKIDQYGLHTISNIYYDTDNYAITRDSIDRPVYKEKLRVRAYGTPEPKTGQVFVELKKKYDHVVYKRRIAVPIGEANDFLTGGPDPKGADPQIAREIRYFMQRTKPEPKVYLSYQRIAMAGRENPELRITMDQELLWRTYDLDLCLGPYGQRVLPEDMTLMEIKVPGAMPLWLAQTLSRHGIYQSSFSKIGTCYTRFILPDIFDKKVVTTHV